MLPTIKVDADTRNIEELEVEADPTRFRAAQDARADRRRSRPAVSLRDYDGMMAEMKKGTLVIDDICHHEIEKLIEIYKPDIICSGIKDKFMIEKMGVPCKQLHSYDYGGPYAAFIGAANFYREIDRMMQHEGLEARHAAVEADPPIPPASSTSRRPAAPKPTRQPKTWKPGQGH